MAHFKRASDEALREEVMEGERRMTALRVRLSDPPGTVYPADRVPRAVADGGAAARARLRRLEAGEPIRVQGWQVGAAKDFGSCLLDGHGRLTPIDRGDGP